MQSEEYGNGVACIFQINTVCIYEEYLVIIKNALPTIFILLH
jgi:hypothetical protein